MYVSTTDGTLHHIGEGLRRMSASNGSDATHQGDKGGHTNLHFRERKRTLSNFSRLEESYNVRICNHVIILVHQPVLIMGNGGVVLIIFEAIVPLMGGGGGGGGLKIKDH